MIWLPYSLLNAFFESLKDVFGKKVSADLDEYALSFFLRFLSVPFLLPLVVIQGLPKLAEGFWWILAASLALNVPVTVLYMRAIKISDISLSVPMLAFTPIFLLITSPLMLGESPSSIGLIGILIAALGAYVMHFSQRRRGLLEPFRALLTQKGPRLMLIVAFIWSITANIDKHGVIRSSPIFWAFIFNLATSAVLLPMVFLNRRSLVSLRQLPWVGLILLGGCSALSLTFQMIALRLTIVPYAISVKRTSAIFSVLFGALIFKEKNARERLIGACILLSGAILVALGAK